MQVLLLDSQFLPIKNLTENISQGSFTRNVNNIGEGFFTLSDITDELFLKLDKGILFISIPEESEAFNTLWYILDIIENKQGLEIQFADAKVLVRRNIVAYKSDSPEGTQPFGRIKNKAANSAMVDIVRQNLGDLAGDRNLGVDYIPASPSDVIIDLEISFRIIEGVFNQIIDSSLGQGERVYYDFIFEDNKLLFKTFVGSRGVSRDIVLSNSLPEITDWEFKLSNEVTNVGYAVGLGRGVGQPIKRVGNRKFNLFERFEKYSVTDSNEVNVLNSVANSVLNESRVIISLETSESKKWKWGDLVKFRHRNTIYDLECYAVEFNVNTDSLLYYFKGRENEQ